MLYNMEVIEGKSLGDQKNAQNFTSKYAICEPRNSPGGEISWIFLITSGFAFYNFDII